ncbi:Thyrotropin-releasing hormone receptor [Armadillidium nasatum]|uniref:Thyrotropin-releasing hormone receptor n=1 Tax=Armadillidium nasatum TaxID=96803 RepID=A0A5N5SNX8_9CRUS|nr:Thyrotropin-releasing hormone receptor [Armadillidium nasatum]
MEILAEYETANMNESPNCSWSFLTQNGLDEEYLFDNDSFENDADLTVNCSELHQFGVINCSHTDYLCICAQELYIRACYAFLKSNPEYFSYIYRIIGTFFQGIIFVIGVIGNVMVVIVVAKNRNMSTPTNCYLVSLAIADCIVLVAAVPQEIVSYYLIGNQWIWGKIGCSLLIFFQNLGINASSLSLTAFTIERYIAICHPIKAQTVCTVERAKKITFFVWFIAICYCSPWLFLTKIVPINYDVSYPTRECTFKLSREQYLYYFILDIIVFYVIPLILSCILYSLIGRILFTSQVSKNINSSSGNGPHDTKRNNSARVQGKLIN